MPTNTPTLVWLGNPVLAPHMRDLGWRVVVHNYVKPEPLAWPDLCGLAEQEPDAVILIDKSRPPMLLGVERFPCPTLFHCVDSHIHSWHPDYAQAFDFCTVSLKDHMPRFLGGRLPEDRIQWLPPFAAQEDRPPDHASDHRREWDLLFVGKMNPATSPRRCAFMDELRKRLPFLEVRQGDYRELFARARLVLNYAEREDLNFRVFEALGCGACLVTPRVAHGQAELFADGRDLFCYDMEDMDGLVKLVKELLADPERCEKAAQSGLARVNAAHRAMHRAQSLDRLLRGPEVPALVNERLEQARAIHEAHLRLLYLHFAEVLADPARAPLRRAYLNAARSYT